MGAKRTIRSNSSKVVEPSTPKINRPLMGGDEILQPMSSGSFPLSLKTTCLIKVLIGTVPYTLDLPYMACGELGDLLTMDLDLKHIP